MYVTDGRTDGRTEAKLTAPVPTGGRITISQSIKFWQCRYTCNGPISDWCVWPRPLDWLELGHRSDLVLIMLRLSVDDKTQGPQVSGQLVSVMHWSRNSCVKLHGGSRNKHRDTATWWTSCMPGADRLRRHSTEGARAGQETLGRASHLAELSKCDLAIKSRRRLWAGGP